MKIKQYNIQDDMFQFKVNVFTGGRYDDLRKLISRTLDVELEEYEDRTRGLFSEVSPNTYVFWVESINDTITLTHEVLHLVFYICREKGIGLSEESEEVFAYMQGWWMDKILKLKSKKK